MFGFAGADVTEFIAVRSEEDVQNATQVVPQTFLKRRVLMVVPRTCNKGGLCLYPLVVPLVVPLACYGIVTCIRVWDPRCRPSYSYQGPLLVLYKGLPYRTSLKHQAENFYSTVHTPARALVCPALPGSARH